MYRETDLDACKALVTRALEARDAIAPPRTATTAKVQRCPSR